MARETAIKSLHADYGRAGVASCASWRACCGNQAPAAGSSIPHSGSKSAWPAASAGQPGWPSDAAGQALFDPLWGVDDPAAGAWFPQQALQLAQDATPALP